MIDEGCISEERISIPVEFVERQKAKPCHRPGFAVKYIVVIACEPDSGDAGWCFQFCLSVGVDGLAAGICQYFFEQGIWSIVICPPIAGISQILKAGVDGAMVIGYVVLQSGGHHELVSDGDFAFFFRWLAGPSCSQKPRTAVCQIQDSVLLCFADEKGRQRFTRRSPVPDAVFCKAAEVFLDYDFSVFEYDERFAVFLLKVLKQAVGFIGAPSQTLRRQCVPKSIVVHRREIQILAVGIESQKYEERNNR